MAILIMFENEIVTISSIVVDSGQAVSAIREIYSNSPIETAKHPSVFGISLKRTDGSQILSFRTWIKN